MRPQITLTLGALLASCTAAPPPSAATPGNSTTAPVGADCPITGSSDWAAWVNAMPGPGAKPKLIIIGKVTVPTGGYQFSWDDLRVMESYPVQVVATLRVTPPAGSASQAVVTQDIRGEWQMSPPVGSVTVRCGDRELARISPVETAH